MGAHAAVWLTNDVHLFDPLNTLTGDVRISERRLYRVKG
jgi:hypothetical protein